MDNPRPRTISLVIPAYNEEAYLPACLDAVMRNVADKALEIIVVDNNSSDGTRQVVERYPTVKYVFEPIKGITRARQQLVLSHAETRRIHGSDMYGMPSRFLRLPIIVFDQRV